MAQDLRPGEFRDFCGAVRRPVVHDDDLVRVLSRLQHDGADCGALVERGDCDDDVRVLSKAFQVLACLFGILDNGQGLPPSGARRSFRRI